ISAKSPIQSEIFEVCRANIREGWTWRASLALLQEPVSSTLYGSRFLRGEVGGSVTHQCFYSITPANKHDRKYWCKIAGSGVCYTIVSTTGYTSKSHAGRVSLEDIPQNGTFTVTMTELKRSDAGTYRCGIGTTNRDLYVSLNLTVLAGRTLAGERGGSAAPAARLAGSRLGPYAGASAHAACSLHTAGVSTFSVLCY
ncbi:PREDICTED: high affinity immunoglobulin alpha and immunoglobulin mu Fc receptor-like, partial [Phaethon lepturus]|uniref:high affinity immunoglobulin alpha and immunoglobulin mu Fc receptor-like n=1 Tax=Phaethon lepturus TaxID=97097 RepID=UPI000530896F